MCNLECLCDGVVSEILSSAFDQRKCIQETLWLQTREIEDSYIPMYLFQCIFSKPPEIYIGQICIMSDESASRQICQQISCHRTILTKTNKVKHFPFSFFNLLDLCTFENQQKSNNERADLVWHHPLAKSYTNTGDATLSMFKQSLILLFFPSILSKTKEKENGNRRSRSGKFAD